MKQLFSALLACTFAITAVSCKHREDPAPVAASMTIRQPVINQVFKAGDTIAITGTINGIETMHGYKVCIIKSNGDSLCKIHNHTHASKIDINERWIDSTASTGVLRIIVSSAINHEGDEVKKEIPVQVNP